MAISDDSAWNISGSVTDPLTSETVTVDIDLDVADSYTFPRPEPARKALDPCGGPPTLIYRSDGTMPRRVGSPTFRIDGDDVDADTLYAALLDIYRLRGSWTLTPPDATGFPAVVDPTVAQWSAVNHGTWVDVAFGWSEVDA